MYILKNNLYELGLDLCGAKTILLHVNRKNIPPGSLEIEFDGLTIKSSETAKFLGITFDYQMTFTSQINNIKKKCLKANNIIKFLCGTRWGSSPQTLIMIYKSFVRSLIEYGIFVYFPTRKTEIEKLEKIQLSSLRTALGFRSTTPTNIILEEAKIPLIRERAIFLCKAYILKVLSNTNLPVNNSINRFFNKTKNNKFKRKRLLQKCIEECYQNHKNKIRPDSHYSIYISDYHTTVSDIPVNTELGSLLKKSKDVNETLSDIIKLPNCVDIYTDGSKIKIQITIFCLTHLALFSLLKLQK